jgi:hypothetical protein
VSLWLSIFLWFVAAFVSMAVAVSCNRAVLAAEAAKHHGTPLWNIHNTVTAQ